MESQTTQFVNGRPPGRKSQSPGSPLSARRVNGKNLWIYYHAPSVRGRHIFNGAGALQSDGSVWRLGGDYATVLHTDPDLDLNGLAIPKCDYTLYADLDNGQWKLIVNKTLMAGGATSGRMGMLRCLRNGCRYPLD